MASFDDRVRRVLWERAGHRCSKCGRGTSKPDPENPEQSILLGEGSHICVDKGPRFDPNMTAEERGSARNGIWLCERCHNEMDKAFAAYPADMIRNWKETREARTARDASATPDEIAGVLT